VAVATLVSPSFTSTPTLAPPTATLVSPTQPPPTAKPLSPTPEPVLSTRTPPPAPTATPKPPLPRVDLAFVGAHPDDYGREIYAYYEGDDTPHRLTESVENDGYPAVSPGRTLIAFESGRNEGAGSDIWLMNSDGSNQDAQPAFSPDGKTIVFASMRGGTMQLYLMDLSGGNIRHVPAPGWCYAPSFSPDGRQLVFISTEVENVYNLFVVNLDGSGLRQITFDAKHYENPSFLDGETILFDSDNPGDKQVLRIKVDGTGLTNLTNSLSSDRQPVLSWDGSTIAFQRITDGMPHIWLMNRDGGGQRQKTDLGLYGELDPAWSR
jgi:TolB protein